MSDISADLWGRARREVARHHARAFGAPEDAASLDTALRVTIEGVRTVLTFELQRVAIPELPEVTNLPPPMRKKLDELTAELQAMFMQFQAVKVVAYALGELIRVGVTTQTAQEIIAALRQTP